MKGDVIHSDVIEYTVNDNGKYATDISKTEIGYLSAINGQDQCISSFAADYIQDIQICFEFPPTELYVWKYMFIFQFIKNVIISLSDLSGDVEDIQLINMCGRNLSLNYLMYCCTDNDESTFNLSYAKRSELSKKGFNIIVPLHLDKFVRNLVKCHNHSLKLLLQCDIHGCYFDGITSSVTDVIDNVPDNILNSIKVSVYTKEHYLDVSTSHEVLTCGVACSTRNMVVDEYYATFDKEVFIGLASDKPINDISIVLPKLSYEDIDESPIEHLSLSLHGINRFGFSKFEFDNIVNKYNSMGPFGTYKGFVSYSFCSDGIFSLNSALITSMDAELTLKLSSTYKGPIYVVYGQINTEIMIMGIPTNDIGDSINTPVIIDVSKYIKIPSDLIEGCINKPISDNIKTDDSDNEETDKIIDKINSFNLNI